MTRNGTRHPPPLAMRATRGTPTTPDNDANAINSPNALALVAGVRTSATAAMLLGGIMPPERPVTTLSASNNPKLEAKLDANTLMPNKPSPATATGRLPNESEIGPTEITEIAQAAKVAAANCPVAAMDTSNSSAKSTKSGANISPTVWVTNIAAPVSTRKRACRTAGGVITCAN